MKVECSDCKRIWEVSSVNPSAIRFGPTRGFKVINVIEVVSHLLSGIGWNQYEQQKSTSNQPKLSRGAWERIEKHVWSTVHNVAIEEERKARSEAVSSTTPIVLSGDYAWSHRRNANAGVYALIDFSTDKILVHHSLTRSVTRTRGGVTKVVHEGNYKGSSKGMEFVGFRECIKQLLDENVLQKVFAYVSDKDGSVQKDFKVNPLLQHITLLHDPGHIAVNMKKELERRIGKSKRYGQYPQHIVNWWWVCLKKAVEFRNKSQKTRIQSKSDFLAFLSIGYNKFKELWSFMPAHYSREQCPKECPCFYTVKPLVFKMPEVISFTKLPEELIEMIWKRLTSKEVRCVAATCQQFYRIAFEQLAQEGSKKKSSNERWLNPQDPSDLSKLSIIKAIHRKMNDSCEEFAHGFNTCSSESFNHLRAMRTQKG